MSINDLPYSSNIYGFSDPNGISYQTEKAAAMAAVQKNGRALEYAREDMKKDKEVVMAAVQKNGQALQYAHEDMKRDKEVVMAAVQKDGGALRYAHEDIKKDKEFAIWLFLTFGEDIFMETLAKNIYLNEMGGEEEFLEEAGGQYIKG